MWSHICLSPYENCSLLRYIPFIIIAFHFFCYCRRINSMPSLPTSVAKSSSSSSFIITIVMEVFNLHIIQSVIQQVFIENAPNSWSKLVLTCLPFSFGIWKSIFFWNRIPQGVGTRWRKTVKLCQIGQSDARKLGWSSKSWRFHMIV